MLNIGPEAFEELAGLGNNPSLSRLYERVVDVLSTLEPDPGDTSVRAIRLQYRSIWGVPIRWADEERIVVWRKDENRTSVLYIGRDFR